MERMTAGEIAKAVGGQILAGDPALEVTDICTDSRQCKEGDLYVPILGERVDGHRFLTSVISQGAAAVFTSEHTKEAVEAMKPEERGTAVWIQVEDTRMALQRLGGFCRNRLQIPFVGVTGSVGKTSTRSMIATALSGEKRTFQTAGNANSQIGVPITLSRVPGEAEAAVIELGMSQPGEMEKIAAIAGLDVAVMTNIGISHIEQLGSQANILREKLHITDGLKKDGYLILNGDDPYLRGQGEEPVPELDACVARFHTCYYGLQEENDYRAVKIEGKEGKTCFQLIYHGGTVPVVLPVIGLHHVRNALAALACADVMGLSVEIAAKALSGFSGVAHRQEILTLDSLGITVVDDSYNASPESMEAALTTLKLMEAKGRKIAVLADMFELGPNTKAYHFQVGEKAGRMAPDLLITVGELAREIRAGALSVNPDLPVMSFADRFQMGEWLEKNRKPGDLILFKGSNGMKLFEIVENWKKSL
jgi:UDP-N-acetylmuramoyl-tripeptide--D-alanyl-D-alanine ligase